MLPGIRTFLALSFMILATTSEAQNRGGQDRRRSGPNAQGEHGAVATGSQASAEAALEMLKNGGNAVDAAVTSLLVQTVVESNLFCFGGEVPILIYIAERKRVEALVGLGAAPRLANIEWFEKNRKGLIQGRGDIANAVVPGTLSACVTALERYGTRTFGQCAEAMLEILAERAARKPEQLGRRIRDKEAWIRHHQNFHRLITRLVHAEQEAGSDRLAGLRAVHDTFYRGPIAKEIDAWSRESGGLLRYTDFALHHTRVEEPLAQEFHGHTVMKCGPWTQGPFLLQTLRLLEGYDLASMTTGSSSYIHLVVEMMKLAFADRDAFYGDPAFVDVPMKSLLSDEYTELRRDLFDEEQASLSQTPGNPMSMKALLGKAPQDHDVTSGWSDDTSNCVVADRWGNVVAATPSGWGGVIAGDTGVELGSRMIGLNCWADHPSQVMPGKRPRITLTPTLVFREGQPVFAISVAGGDQQDQASLQILLNRIIHDMEPKEAVQAPRVGTDHHINWFGHEAAKLGSLTVSRGLSSSAVEALRSLGHDVKVGRSGSIAVVLALDPESGTKRSAGERGRAALAY